MSDVPVPSHLSAFHAFGSLALAVFDDVMKPRNGDELNSTLEVSCAVFLMKHVLERVPHRLGARSVPHPRVLELHRSSIDNNIAY